MPAPLQVGVTGGIGSGKSLVCEIFERLGAPVYDADSRAKALMTTDGILIREIKKEFGNLSYHPDGALNRKYLSETAFQEPERLELLNKLVHPRVGIDYGLWVAKQVYPYVIKEAALFFEAGSNNQMDKIVLVSAPEELRMRRVLARDANRSEKMVRDIMGKQMPEEMKKQKADYVIINDESQLVIPQVLELHDKFMKAGN